MRRGTPSAELFGQLVRVIRVVRTDKTMNQFARDMGKAPAFVSQIEKGQRALKEPSIKAYSDALWTKEEHLRVLWLLCQGWLLVDDEEARYFYEDLNNLCEQITQQMKLIIPKGLISNGQFPARIVVHGLDTIMIPEIPKDNPIVRVRRSAIKADELYEEMKDLTAPERNRVLGYIHALKEQREG
jgi:transcriptional regulator with XRE-family HTH domain